MGDRLRPALSALLTLGAGLGLRALAAGAVAKYGGVALWATLVYFLLRAAMPRQAPARCAWLCIAISFAVELFQLTPVPSALHDLHPAFALVFGTTFHALDLPAYVAGALLGLTVDRLTTRSADSQLSS